MVETENYDNEVGKKRHLKLNVDKSKVIVFGREERPVCEALVDGR